MAYSTIADLTVDEFRKLIREVVIQTLSEMIGDPDKGLELNDDFKSELRISLVGIEEGIKTIPAQKVATDLGMKL